MRHFIKRLFSSPIATPAKGFDFDAAQSALVVIDMQNQCCAFDPPGTPERQQVDAVAARINDLADIFHRAGRPVYSIAWHYLDSDPPAPDRDQFYIYRPDPARIFYRQQDPARTRDSGFASKGFAKALERDDVETLLFCGVNLSFCVYQTYQDAPLWGQKAAIIRDLSLNVSTKGNPRAPILAAEIDNGSAVRTTSAAVRAAFSAGPF